MKRKHVLSLILALALTLALAATALATDATLDPDYQRVMQAIAEKEEALGMRQALWSAQEKYDFQEQFRGYFERNEIFSWTEFGIPGEDDMQQDDIIAMAEEAILERYGETAFNADFDWEIAVYYYKTFNDGRPQWHLHFMNRRPEDPDIPTVFYEVWIDAETGEFLKFNGGEEAFG